MINTIFSNRPIKFSAAVAGRNNILPYVSVQRDSITYPSGQINSDLVPIGNGSWGLGTGYLVSGAGAVVFNSATAGGALSSVYLVNKSASTLYVNLNEDAPSTSGALILEYNDSVTFHEKISKIGVMSLVGTGTLGGHGLYDRSV